MDNTWSSILEIVSAPLAASSTERLGRIVCGIKQLIPCDSAILLRLEGDSLVPIASKGLVPEVSGQRFVISEHPRLAQFMRVSRPVRIEDCDLPDPFDGLIGDDVLGRVHACMGCRLEVDGDVIGVLAIDAIDPRAFDDIDDDEVAAYAALAAIAMRTDLLIEQLSEKSIRADRVARDLARHAADRTSADLVGQSAAIAEVRDEISVSARSDLTVLITGETGTGKEVVARAIHRESSRGDRPLIYVNCAALPDSIAESELFGHVRGAFTGATDHRSGKFEVADGGTLFLDEIGELPLAIQPKLLRALQSGEIQRVGSDKLLRVDVRIIAATNRDLATEMAAGRFRADLFHRLSVYPIRIPSLRQRREDICLLAGFFLNDARLRLGLGRIRLTADARSALEAADWPGNVRELEHAILRAALRASGGRRRELVVIDATHLGLVAPVAPANHVVAIDEVPLHAAADLAKRARIVAALDASGGNWAQTARSLGMDRGNLHRLARRLGLISRTACASPPQD
ncbi:MAG: nitric oxide reductase transcriptional regulator NorR [Kofleriaceae bacterium]